MTYPSGAPGADNQPDPLEGHSFEMQTYELLELYRRHQYLAQLALALAVQTYLYTPNATPVGAARIVEGKDPHTGQVEA